MNNYMLRSFWDELEKIAAEEAEIADSRQRILGQIAGAGVGLGGALVVGRHAPSMVYRNLAEDVAANPMTTSATDVKRLSKEIAPDANVMLGGGIGEASHIPPGSSASEMLRHQGVPEKVINEIETRGINIAPGKAGRHFAAHELGHEAATRSAWGKLRAPLRGVGKVMTYGAAPGAAILTDPDSTLSKASPLLALAGTMPTLGEEAFASLKGYGALKRMGSSPRALAVARRQLGKAFGSYASHAAPWVAAPYAIRKIRQAIGPNKQEVAPQTEQVGG